MTRPALLVCLALAACGGPSTELPRSLVVNLAREDRTSLYDQENDLVIARNGRDDARVAVEARQRDMDELDARWSRAEKRLKKAGASDRASGAKTLVKAKRAYIEAELKADEAAERKTEIDCDLAEARLVQLRKRLLVRSGLSQSSEMASFDTAVNTLDRDVQQAQRKELDLRVQAQKSFEAWKQAEDTYTQSTKDFDSLVWID